MIYLITDDRYFSLGVEALFQELNQRIFLIPLDETGSTGVIPQLAGDDVMILALEQADTLAPMLAKARYPGARAMIIMDNASEATFTNITILSKKVSLVGLPQYVEADDTHLKSLPPLTAREMDIMGELATGKTPYHISRELNLSVKTICTHKLSALKKLGLNHLNARSVIIYGKIFHGAGFVFKPMISDRIRLDQVDTIR